MKALQEAHQVAAVLHTRQENTQGGKSMTLDQVTAATTAWSLLSLAESLRSIDESLDRLVALK